MPLTEKKVTALLEKIRDASRRTLIAGSHDLFSYLESEAPNSPVRIRYEDERGSKWGRWTAGKNMGAWEMPLDEDERKSLAYHLYRCVVESRDAGNGVLFWMYHESFEQNVIDFQQDFFGLLVRVVEDIYNLEHATAKSISSDSENGKDILVNNDFPKVFVSHAAKDAVLAKALVDCLEACLEIPDKTIRCTSVPGYRLAPGDDADEVLRDNLARCSVVLGLLTDDSLASGYVVMELGAAWGLKRTTCAILAPNIDFGRLPGPLSRRHAIKADKDHDIASLMELLADKAGLALRSPAKLTTAVAAFVAAATRFSSLPSHAHAQPAVPIESPGQKAHRESPGSTSSLHELEVQRLLAELAIAVSVRQDPGSGTVGQDLVMDFAVRNNGEKPIQVSSASATWRYSDAFVRTISPWPSNVAPPDQPRPARVVARVDGAQPGHDAVVRVLYHPPPEEAHFFSPRSQASQAIPRVCVDLLVRCRNTAGTEKDVQATGSS